MKRNKLADYLFITLTVIVILWTCLVLVLLAVDISGLHHLNLAPFLMIEIIIIIIVLIVLIEDIMAPEEDDRLPKKRKHHRRRK